MYLGHDDNSNVGQDLLVGGESKPMINDNINEVTQDFNIGTFIHHYY